ncbi:branched-chain amino acid aminotransferase [Christensenellaceae bacterium OttesenSCG-928-M15]|nr:branched-chain amino acid aminotransferase [Christensenellaceae bacterium OttesenSCG-928-M15]
MNIQVTKTASPLPKPQDETSLGFGKKFSDHMFVMDYAEGKGWFNERIVPYGPFSIDPASPVLHYGQEIFEGLKAYRSANNDILLFRPRDNALRMNRSAERMCMPPIDPDEHVEAIKAIVDCERDWVPSNEGTSLYLRPTMIADGSELGVHAAHKYIHYIICSPSGAYYKNGLAPISIYVEDKYVRAVKGGTGFAKTGGNYASSMLAALEAEKKGFDQVLWLDGMERKYVEEVGAMNMMFIIDDVLVTAALEGSILAGVTRMSILQLARDMGIKVEERQLSIDELMKAGKSGALKEAFGTGTAAVISPVGKLTFKEETITVNNGEIGSLTQKFYDTLTGIQTGKLEDKYGWVVKV